MPPPIASAQVNLYAAEPDRLARFYSALGLAERFRFPATGPAEHVEVCIEGLTLGLTSREAMGRLAGLPVAPGTSQAELVLWTDDVPAMLAHALQIGAVELAGPRVFHDRIVAAWIRDQEGHILQLVAPLQPAPTSDS